MLATVLAGIAEFERDLLRERVRSGLAAARARGKVLGRRPGQRPKSDRLAPKVLALVGLQPDQVIYVQAGDDKTVPEALRHGSLEAVVAEVASLNMPAARRAPSASACKRPIS